MNYSIVLTVKAMLIIQNLENMQTGSIDMDKKPEFHGSDIEKIAAYYNISKDSITSYSANVNPLGLSPFIKEQLAANLDVLTRYPDRDYTALREAIGAYCSVAPAYIVVGNGSTELISLLINRQRPQKALVIGPTYSEYARELSLTGGTLEYYNLREEENFVLNIPSLLSSVTPGTDLLILCNPNNPTSSAINVDRLEEIIHFCSKKNIFVMIDETYAEFAPDPDAITAAQLIPQYDNFMIIRGVSKFFAAPGLRFGYGITGNTSFLEAIHLYQNPWSLNSIGAFAGELMMKDNDYIHKSWQLIDQERTRLYGILSSWDNIKVYPPYANFILIKILKKDLTSFEVFEYAVRRGMMIRDCSSFESLDGEYIRFCFMKPEDNNRLINCLSEVLNNK